MAEAEEQDSTRGPVLKVLDVLDHPHGGRIARVRIDAGTMPDAATLRGATLKATGPAGEERTMKVLGFALTGGKASDARLRETGRADLHVQEEGEGPPIDLTWRLTLV